MNKTMYRAHSWKCEIEAVEIVKETPSFVTVVETDWQGTPVHSRRKRDGYYDTWQDCRSAMVQSWRLRAVVAKNELQRLRSVVGNWESLKEPS